MRWETGREDGKVVNKRWEVVAIWVGKVRFETSQSGGVRLAGKCCRGDVARGDGNQHGLFQCNYCHYCLVGGDTKRSS